MRVAKTPLGVWQYDPKTGLNMLDTDGSRAPWKPLVVSIALTGECRKGCPFCYASSTPAGVSGWNFADLVAFAVDLDRNGVFCITLGGGEPVLWNDPEAGKTFYDLIQELHTRLSTSLTFTTSGNPILQYDLLPNIPVRLSCHYPREVNFVLRTLERLRAAVDHVGVNLVLWRSRLNECRDAIHGLAKAGIDDVLLLPLRPAGLGVNFVHEGVGERELQAFLRSLDTGVVRLSACEEPGDFCTTDMGCGANDWFISVTEHRLVKACSFIETGHRLTAPTYQALLEAKACLPRLGCYRPFASSRLGRLAGL